MVKKYFFILKDFDKSYVTKLMYYFRNSDVSLFKFDNITKYVTNNTSHLIIFEKNSVELISILDFYFHEHTVSHIRRAN